MVLSVGFCGVGITGVALVSGRATGAVVAGWGGCASAWTGRVETATTPAINAIDSPVVNSQMCDADFELVLPRVCCTNICLFY